MLSCKREKWGHTKIGLVLVSASLALGHEQNPIKYHHHRKNYYINQKRKNSNDDSEENKMIILNKKMS